MKTLNVLNFLILASAMHLLSLGCKTAEFVTEVSHGSGDFTFDAPGSNLDDDTDADLTKIFFEGYEKESKVGGGIRIEMTDVDDDLFVDKGFLPADSKVLDIYPYGMSMIIPDNDYFRMPIRYGLYYNYFNLDDPVGEIEWNTVGPRFSLEPTVSFTINEEKKIRFDIFAEGNAGVGATWVDVSMAGISDDETSWSYSYGFEGGLRFTAYNFSAGLSYVHRFTHVDETDVDYFSLFQVEETEIEFDGVVFTLGVRF